MLNTIADPPSALYIAAPPATSYTYDAAGNELIETLPAGEVTSYSYGEVGELVGDIADDQIDTDALATEIGDNASNAEIDLTTEASVGESTTEGIAGITRLDPDELNTGLRLLDEKPDLGLQLSESPHEGAEFVDQFGNTYDAMGKPAAYQNWNPWQFFRSISTHLLKANTFTVIDLTGASAAQAAAIQAYVAVSTSAEN